MWDASGWCAGCELQACEVSAVAKRQTPLRESQEQVLRRIGSNTPDRLWVADVTYIATWAGWLYLAVVVEAWRRKVVGWAMSPHLHTDLVLGALHMAIQQRQPEGVIPHSDQGSAVEKPGPDRRLL
jgi:putative transposase